MSDADGWAPDVSGLGADHPLQRVDGPTWQQLAASPPTPLGPEAVRAAQEYVERIMKARHLAEEAEIHAELKLAVQQAIIAEDEGVHPDDAELHADIAVRAFSDYYGRLHRE